VTLGELSTVPPDPLLTPYNNSMKKASLARPTTETRPFIIQRTGNRKIYRLYVYDGKFITLKTKKVKYRYTTLVESYVRKDCEIAAQEWFKGNMTEWWSLV